MTNAIRWLPVLVMIAAASSLAADPQPRPTKDKDAIKGTWRYGSVLDQGIERPMPPETRVVITSDMIQIVYPKDDPMGWKYTIDPSKDPKEMDWIVELDPGHPIRQPAIYKLKGDTLTIASAAAGKPRPTNFESKKGDFGGVWILKRAVEFKTPP